MSDKSIPIIEVRNLKKSYGSFVAVKGISFTVNKREIFGFLGPNGAGKTTSLEIMETLRQKTSGEVIIDGYSVDGDQSIIKGIIGVQLQQSGFYPSLNLIEILDLFEGLYDVEVDKIAALDTVGLADKAKEKYDKLSGGQKQRFSLCTTLIHKPKIVFLDEPTTGLDPQARRHLWDLIRKIRGDGATVMLTTHYMDEAEELCDRIAIIDSGEIIQIDTPDNLIDDLLSRGFKKPKQTKDANLEDVFLDLTGKGLREESNASNPH